MTSIKFVGDSPSGDCNEYAYFGPDLEACLDTMNQLVSEGWTLYRVRLAEPTRPLIDLPVLAFDGSPITDSLLSIEAQWQAILA